MLSRIAQSGPPPFDRRFGPYEVFDFMGVGSIAGLIRGTRLTASGGANGTIVDPYGNLIAASNPRITHDPVGITNWCMQSEALNVSPWVGSPSVTVASETYLGSPFWTIAKTLGTANETEFQQFRPMGAGDSATCTLALLAGTASGVTIGFYGATGAWGLAANATAEILAGPGTLTRQTGAAWQVTNLSATVPTVLAMRRVYPSADTQCSLYIYPGTSASTTIGHSVKVARPMVEFNVSSPSAVYVPTVAAPASAMRSRLGLLAEWASTNKVTQSQASTGFVAAGTTPPTVNSSVTYLGEVATHIVFPSGSDVGYAGCRANRTGNQFAVTAGQPISCSIYISLNRALTGSEQVVYYPTGASGGLEWVLTASNSAQFVGRWGRIELPNMTMIVTGNDYANFHVKVVLGSALSLYVCKEQDEDGRLCTSYIPTTVSTVLRTAGSFGTLSPAEVGLSSDVGAVYAEFVVPGNAQTSVAVGLSTSTSASLFVSSSGIVAGWNGAGQLGTSGTPAVGAVCKAVYTWSGPNQKVCRDGGAVASNASGAPVVTAFWIGAANGSGSPLSTPVRRVMTFDRFLTDAEMQALTTL